MLIFVQSRIFMFSTLFKLSVIIIVNLELIMFLKKGQTFDNTNKC